MAGPERFELSHEGVKVLCLTAWLWSYPFTFCTHYYIITLKIKQDIFLFFLFFILTLCVKLYSSNGRANFTNEQTEFKLAIANAFEAYICPTQTILPFAANNLN